jgi:type IV pilus assembly protein PilO
MASIVDRIAVTGKPLFFAGGFIACGIYYLMSGNPTELIDRQNTELQNQTASINQKIREAEARLANKAKFQEEMERLSLTFKLALEYLPKDLEIEDILKKTSLEARAAGVELSGFTPKESSSKDFYEEKPVDIKLRGPYGQLVTFLANISKLPRIINVRDVEIGSPKYVDGVPLMEFRGTLVVYRYTETKL